MAQHRARCDTDCEEQSIGRGRARVDDDEVDAEGHAPHGGGARVATGAAPSAARSQRREDASHAAKRAPQRYVNTFAAQLS